MAQLNFAMNYYHLPSISNSQSIGDATITFIPFNIWDSISINTVQAVVLFSEASSKTLSFSLGLYSLTGSTLSIANSLSNTNSIGDLARNFYISFTNTSAAQNITPGTWWWGLLGSSAGTGTIYLLGGTVRGNNAFPGSFIGGAMTASTSVLPSSVATSDLDVTANANEFFVPMIIISA